MTSFVHTAQLIYIHYELHPLQPHRTALSWPRSSSCFMHVKMLLPCLLVPAILSYSEPAQSTPQPDRLSVTSILTLITVSTITQQRFGYALLLAPQARSAKAAEKTRDINASLATKKVKGQDLTRTKYKIKTNSHADVRCRHRT